MMLRAISYVSKNPAPLACALLPFLLLMTSSCRDTLPEQSIDDMMWKQVQLSDYFVALPAVATQRYTSSCYYGSLYELCYSLLPPMYTDISSIRVDKYDEEISTWSCPTDSDVGDVLCWLQTYEDDYAFELYRVILLVREGKRPVRIRVMTSYSEVLYNEKVKDRLEEDQRIYEHIRDNIMLRKDGELVKPRIVTLSRAIERPHPCGPLHMVRDLEVTGFSVDLDPKPEEETADAQTQSKEEEGRDFWGQGGSSNAEVQSE